MALGDHLSSIDRRTRELLTQAAADGQVTRAEFDRITGGAYDDTDSALANDDATGTLRENQHDHQLAGWLLFTAALNQAAQTAEHSARLAVSRAGGTQDPQTEIRQGRTPAGIATGPQSLAAFAETGRTVSGYSWRHGGSRNAFSPHVDLSGTVFAQWDDPVLSNTYGWPDEAYFFPGDHDGCSCDAVPMMIEAEELTAAVSNTPWGNFTAADYSPEQWARACLIDTGQGATDSKSRYKLPVKEPSGTINRNGAHAAASVLAGGRGGVQASPDQKRSAARKLATIYRRDLGEEPPPSLVSLASSAAPAGTAPSAPPDEWFADPRFTGPSPVKIDDEGHVYGHLAAWDQCHTSFEGTCVTPPREDDYSWFETGEVVTSTGDRLPVGQITMGTGHAATAVGAKTAAEHYDNTGSAVADVRAGTDRHGIWVAGALRPGLSESAVRELRAAALSGDWRKIGNRLRLVAALAVNVPGFPIPRTRARVASGAPTVIVAAGIVQPGTLPRTVLDALAASIGDTPEQRLKELAEIVGDK